MILQQVITTSNKWHIAAAACLITHCGRWIAANTETTSENDLMPPEYICDECLHAYQKTVIEKHTVNGRLVF